MRTLGEKQPTSRNLILYIKGAPSWYGRTAAPREILLYTSSRTRFSSGNEQNFDRRNAQTFASNVKRHPY
ncbi:hypothetical protein CUMW_272030 [Citrus unshiu]|uniref:Uncharacterized protein n=1 Tax=Citrus unshiu TaxID=55188 RepID=A0A2H5QXU5_CITUN|nr:hypothetical protein CUMW_272030 [Citrus unshiu]